MTIRYFFLVSCALLFFALPGLSAQSSLYWRQRTVLHLDMSDGLPHNFVDDVCQDADGMMWFATLGGGVTRFDGHGYVTYDEGSVPALKGNFTHVVVPDSLGRVWIGSDSGVDLYDGKLGTLAPINFASLAAETAFNTTTTGIAFDADGNLWLLQPHTIVCLSQSDGVWDVADKIGTTRSFFALGRDANGVRFVMGDELLFANLVNGHIETRNVRIDGMDKMDEVMCVARRGNELWIGARMGLVVYDEASGVLRAIRHSDADPVSLSQDCITSITFGTQGEVFVATLKGVNVSFDGVHFERLTQDDSELGISLSSNFCNCLLATDAGLWVGTDVSGVDLVSHIGLKASYVSSLDLGTIFDRKDGGDVNHKPVNAFAEGPDGALWVGSVEGGLSRRTKDGSDFVNFNQSNVGLSHNSISCLAFDQRNRLWAGTWGGGLNILDVSDAARPKVLGRVWNDNLGSKFIGAVVADTINHGVWVASTTMVSFVEPDGTVLHPLPDEITDGMNGALGGAVDSHGRLWLGINKGLLVVDLHSLASDSLAPDNLFKRKSVGKFWFFNRRLDNFSFGSSFPSGDSRLAPRVSFIYHARDGRTYVGTDGYGVYLVREEDDSFYFAKMYVADGISSNTINGIAEDAEGTLWVSTPAGLCAWRDDSKSWVRISTESGLRTNCFYWNAALSSPSSGKALFGNLLGFTEVEGLGLVGSAQVAPPVITRLQVSNETVLAAPNGTGYNRAAIWRLNNVEIHESAKSFGLEFSALDFPAGHSVKYEYYLEGFDKQWIRSNGRMRVAQYTNLAPGKYTFHVRYFSTTGACSPERTLNITVVPYFFRTPAFYLSILFLLGFGLFLYLRHRYRQMLRYRQDLRNQVDLRTNELKVQADLLASQKNELEQANDELQRQNEYISKQKEDLAVMAERIQKLSIDKLQFFTNVSHELRSPLTLIGGPIRRALQISSQDEVREQLEMANRSAQALLETVNQIMDFRKVDTDNMTLHPLSQHLESFVRNTSAPFVAYAADRNVRLDVLCHIDAQYVKLDPEAMRKVISNLLSNAIRFSPDGGRVVLCACQLLRNGKPSLYLSVRDQGPGVPEENISRLFDSFYQVFSEKKLLGSYGPSSGVGLYLVKQIVDLAGGEIWAQNNNAVGLSMRLFLPLDISDDSLAKLDDGADGAVGGEDFDMAENHCAPNSGCREVVVLVVDDSKDMRTYVRGILERGSRADGLTYRVVEADNGLKALSIMAEKDIDFVVSDLMMPVMDGLELARRIKSDISFSHTPVLILTAQMAEEYQTESYKVGVESYLHKPFDEKMLLARIEGIIAKRSGDQRKFAISFDTADLNIEHESSDEKFVRRVTDFVKEHFSDPEFSISDITDEMGCSKSMLHKKMQSVMGQSPGNFVRMYRLNVARELLSKRESNDMNVSQIAYEVGFGDPKYFSRCFAKEFGYPPSQL